MASPDASQLKLPSTQPQVNLQGGAKLKPERKKMAEDIPWSPRNTWIVIGVSGSLLVLLIGGTILYESLWKPNSFEYNMLAKKCVPVRSGEHHSMEACVDAI